MTEDKQVSTDKLITDDDVRVAMSFYIAAVINDHPNFDVYDEGIRSALNGVAPLIARRVIEECARRCEEMVTVFASTEYAIGQPLSSFGERFASSTCAEEIRTEVPKRLGLPE